MTFRPAFRVLSPFLIVLAAVLPFWPALKGPFLWDDVSMIVKSGPIKDLASLPLLWNRDYGLIFGEFQYRPLVTLSLFINYACAGLNASVWKEVNIALHALNALLVYYWAARLAKSRAVGFLAALIFAVHPLHAEVVNVAMYRTELLSCACLMAAFIFYLRGDQARGSAPWERGASWVFFGLALAAKPMSAALPLILGLYVLIFPHPVKELKSRLVSLWPYVLLAGFWCGVILPFFRPVFILGTETDLSYGTPFFSRLHARVFVHMSIPLCRYLGGFLCLVPPVLIYPTHVPPFRDNWMPELAGWAILTALACMAWRSRRSYPVLSFSFFFLALGLLPVSQILPFNMLYADRYAYIPTIGCCLGAAFFIMRRLESQSFRWEGLIVTAALLGALATLTVRRCLEWQDPVTLYTNEVLAHPDEIYARLSAASALMDHQDYAQAMDHLRVANSINPEDFRVRFALAHLRVRQGDDAKAAEILAKLEQDFPQKTALFLPFWEESGFVYLRLADLKKALSCFTKALRMNRYRSTLFEGCGLAMIGSGSGAFGASLLKSAASMNSARAEPHRILSLWYESQKDFPQAFIESQQALILPQQGSL